MNSKLDPQLGFEENFLLSVLFSLDPGFSLRRDEIALIRECAPSGANEQTLGEFTAAIAGVVNVTISDALSEQAIHNVKRSALRARLKKLEAASMELATALDSLRPIEARLLGRIYSEGGPAWRREWDNFFEENAGLRNVLIRLSFCCKSLLMTFATSIKDRDRRAWLVAQPLLGIWLRAGFDRPTLTKREDKGYDSPFFRLVANVQHIIEARSGQPLRLENVAASVIRTWKGGKRARKKRPVQE